MLTHVTGTLKTGGNGAWTSLKLDPHSLLNGSAKNLLNYPNIRNCSYISFYSDEVLQTDWNGFQQFPRRKGVCQDQTKLLNPNDMINSDVFHYISSLTF